MLKIGEFSKLSRVSVRMLRHYDQKGLLTPSEIDPMTGYRYYSENQLSQVFRITALKDLGFSLAAIREILTIYDDREALDAYLKVREAELTALWEDTTQKLRLLETARKRLRKDDNMKYNVTVKTLPERYAACVRMTLPRYEDEGMVWSVLCSETAPLHLVPDDPCYCSVTFLDGEFKESDVEVEAQKTVKGTYPDTEHVQFRTLPPVTVASCVFQGGYSHIGEANEAVVAWLTDNGYVCCGPMFNIYHVSPAETQNPEEFVTEVCYPVCKRES